VEECTFVGIEITRDGEDSEGIKCFIKKVNGDFLRYFPYEEHQLCQNETS
jgi:hypothetical protein